MRRSLLFLFLMILISYPAFGEFKHGPVVSWGSYEASGVSAIVTFHPDTPLSDILNATLPEGLFLEKLATWAGDSLDADKFTKSKGFYGRDLSYGIVTFFADQPLGHVLEALRSLPLIASADPNYIHRPLFEPNDPMYASRQGNFRQIAMPEAWNMSQGEGAVVAVIDTGYRTDGMEDSAQFILSGYDFWGEDSDVNDFIGHGTHVSNVIVERTDNGIGCAGMAFRAALLPCKVFPDWDEGAYESDILQAINWAVEQGADVINMSLGGGGFVHATSEAIQNAVENGCTVFAASGNDNERNVNYPARYEACIAVGATNSHRVDQNPSRAIFSNYGPGLDVTAPGVNILQETFGYQGQGYYATGGTSSASPHAAALGALLAAKGGADPVAIREAIELTAYNPADEWTDALGWGEINAFKALRIYAGSNDLPVAVARAFPSNGTAPLSVHFDGGESYDPNGSINAYRWTLNSKILATSSEFDYAFIEEGDYQVALRVIDDEGALGQDQVQITVSESEGDACFQMLDTAYEGCDLQILGSGDDYLSYQQALNECRGGDNASGWECLLECYDQSDGCTAFKDCGQESCGIQMIFTSGGGGDDSTDLCSLCG